MAVVVVVVEEEDAGQLSEILHDDMPRYCGFLVSRLRPHSNS